MIAPDAALRDRHAAELALPDDERRIEQPARTQVREQAGDGQIDFRRMLRVVGLDVLVRVPGIGVLIAEPAMIQLDETNAALHQPPRHQALPSERFRDRVVEAVQLPRGRRLGFEIHDLGGASLHAIGEFVRLDPRGQFGVAGVLLEIDAVELFEQIETARCSSGADVRRRLQVDNRGSRRPEHRALIRSQA